MRENIMKYWLIIFAATALLAASPVSAEQKTEETSMENKEVIKAAFRAAFDSDTVREEAVTRYFSRDYIQHVDGKTIGYVQFIEHLRAQRETIASFHIEFLAMASEGDIVFTNHKVRAVKKDGNEIEAKVIAQFTVCNGQIIACDELTRMVAGSEEDRDLGSRH